MDNQKGKRTLVVYSLAGFIAFVILVSGFFVVKALVSEDADKRRKSVRMVTLVKPPPPPPPQEKPPEPEVRKEEIIEEEPEKAPQESMDEAADDTPVGEQLGMDVDGVAGGDGFGLVAKKGRPLIGGGSSNDSLLNMYAWYNRKVEDRIQKQLQDLLSRDKDRPKEKMSAVVEVTLNDYGAIEGHRIAKSSGDHVMDQAVRKALQATVMDEPPPRGMPRGLRIVVDSRG
ncbi:MAG: TonB family protein [Desulfatibacillaceae bacterium]